MSLPKLPHYGKNALRPNPSAADSARGDLAFALGPVLMGDFGDDEASARRVNGLPTVEKQGKPKNKDEHQEHAAGWR